MAFQAEEKNQFDLGLYIVPVGIDYDNYYKFHRPMMINFGEPVAVSPFNGLYKENPTLAYNSLRDKVSDHLKKVMIDISDIEHYDLIDALRTICRKRVGERLQARRTGYPERLEVDRYLIKIVEGRLKKETDVAGSLSEKVNKYKGYLNDWKFRTWLPEKKKYPVIALTGITALLVLLFPLFLYGLVNNALPFYLPGLATKGVKDPQFLSSVRNGLAIVTFPLFYIIQFAVFSILSSSVPLDLGYLASLPLTGYAAFQYYRVAVKSRAKLRYNRVRKKQPELFADMHRLRSDILQAVDSWIAENVSPHKI
jgi:hypothetical protein